MKKLDSIIDERLNNYLKLFDNLLRLKTVAAAPVNEIEEAAQYLKNIFEERGYSVDIWAVDGNPVIHARIGDGGKTFVIYNHYDVQPAEPFELWDYPPFQLSIVNNHLYGRGVADNKGNIVARIMATDLFIEEYGDNYSIEWIIEGEEEIGSPTLDKVLSQYRNEIYGDAGLWETGYVRPDNRLGFPLGYKGMIYIEIKLKRLKTDVHSGYAPIIPNPALEIVELISKLKRSDGEILFKDIYRDIDEEYLETAKEMAEEFPYESMGDLLNLLGIDSFVGGLTPKEAFLKIVTEPSLNIAGLYSGYTGEGSKTIVPSEAGVKIDIRPLPGQNPNKILKIFTDYLTENGFKDIDIEIHSMYPSGYTKPNEPIIKYAMRAAKDVYGSEAVVSPLSGGSGPIYIFTDKLRIPLAGSGVGYY
ncbi:MAG TPA: M20/M25/M40 family metallo-hydrolase, partial [Thermoprotei archaeon]|nr:M20/M25/M40 family metallo-hydrolase [Thermoprotei archaeon]